MDGATTVRCEDVVYCRHGDETLLARIYRPAGAGPHPAIIDVHGGAWVGADRFHNAPFVERLAERGILVMSIDFRLPPVGRYPTSLSDINLAIRWLKLQAAALGLDAARVGGLGTSSGGHQLMLCALRPDDPRYGALTLEGAPPGLDASLAFAVGCWPVLDPLARYRMVMQNGRQNLIAAHHAYWESEDAMAEGSPQNILDRGERVSLPPCLLIQGTNDGNFDHMSADRFAAAYRRAGGSAELRKYEGEEHGFMRIDPDSAASLDALPVIAEFIWRQHRGG